ncbi:hypothetical protein jhhlp_003036 [Lomentospora prolificans]|uniref:Peptidase M13 C-terminal domain-containing protein n=1 Tax=Lomentospora prolificans TaxID=41688 RepID=A0A2N3NFR2_9PEZI|nr:hypothetical protein jhhlp_003036 [Lomentospora prolificans]
MTAWWNEESLGILTEKTACFVEQYAKFNTVAALNGTQIPASLYKTLGENITDGGGVSSSFAAWKMVEGEEGKAKGIPGLDGFTHEPLFPLR